MSKHCLNATFEQERSVPLHCILVLKDIETRNRKEIVK